MVPLRMCFTDLQKAHLLVDRTLLWEVLARFGVAPRMNKVIRIFHDGMWPEYSWMMANDQCRSMSTRDSGKNAFRLPCCSITSAQPWST